MEVRKECKEPWFSLIRSGKKPYEGRVKKGFWKDVKVGDRFTFYCGTEEFRVEVTEVLEFTDFRDAYRGLGEKLLPGVESEDKCWEINHEYFDDNLIEENGVVAVGITVE